MKTVFAALVLSAVVPFAFAQTTGRIPTATPGSPVGGLTPGAVGGLAPSTPMLTPSPVGGLTPGVVGGLAPQPVGPINQNPVTGFTPGTTTGFTPNAAGGFNQNPVTLTPTPQLLSTNPVSGLTPIVPAIPDTNVIFTNPSPSPF